jgi:hypothetical protein
LECNSSKLTPEEKVEVGMKKRLFSGFSAQAVRDWKAGLEAHNEFVPEELKQAPPKNGSCH